MLYSYFNIRNFYKNNNQGEKEMKKFITLIAFFALITFSAGVLQAQPTIIFKPSSGTILTWQDVFNIAEENELSWNSSFYAVIEETDIIENQAFDNFQKLLSASSETVTKLENRVFYNDRLLASVDFPNVEYIGKWCFHFCSLVSIDFPKIKFIDSAGFSACTALTTVSFGKGFIEPTEIILHENVFQVYDFANYVWLNNTPNLDLVLGDNVLPCWQEGTNQWNGYTWKSITGGCKTGTAEVFYDVRVVVKYGATTIKDTTMQIKENEVFVFDEEQDPCYSFAGLFDKDANLISNESDYGVTIISDTVLVYSYSIMKYEIYVASSDGGTTNFGDGEITILNCGESSWLIAYPDEDYEFVNWTDYAGNELSNENPFAFTIISDTMIIANFNYVSIEETPEIHFTVSPNPAQTQLTIHHSKEIENIGLYDLSGRLLRTYSGAGTITVIDISDLDSGVYFLTVAGKSVKFVKE